MATAVAEVSQGLQATLSDTPLHTFYVQTIGGVGQLTGPFVKAELGAHVAPNVSLFGQAGYERAEGWGADVGIRWNFD